MLVQAAIMNKPTHQSPYDAPELYDLLFEPFEFDLPFWLEVGRAAGGPVLDLACGTGRILLPLLQAGVDADGLDSSRPMIDRLQAKAKDRNITVNAVTADMRDFQSPRRYARIICAFNSFAHCETTDDQIRTLRCCRAHLAPGGALVLHMSYPGPAYWNEADGDAILELETKTADGRTVQSWDTRSKNPVAQCQRSFIEIKQLDRDGRLLSSQTFETAQRWVYGFEMELLLRAAGFARWRIDGGFDGRPLSQPEDQIVAWAWRD